MGYFVSVLLILGVGAVGYYVARNYAWRMQPVAVGMTGLLLLVTTLGNMACQVPAGNVGIVYAFGAITGQRGEGLQWVAPWQSVKYASVQVQGHKFEKLASFSVETQDVFVDATINVQVSPQYIQNLYREVGERYFEILVYPRVLQAFKDETVKYTSVNIAPHREAIRMTVRTRLTNELKEYAIAVQDLLVDNIRFSAKFQDAIEEKQRQTQLALAENEKVAGEKAKANQRIEEARGQGQSILDVANKQAEANEKLAKSITPELVQYIFASRLAPNVNVMMVPSGQQFILNPDPFKKTTAAASQ